MINSIPSMQIVKDVAQFDSIIVSPSSTWRQLRFIGDDIVTIKSTARRTWRMLKAAAAFGISQPHAAASPQ
jgi:hypothetical protein